LIDFLLAKTDKWADVAFDADMRLFARPKSFHQKLEIHVIESARTPLPLEKYKFPCALAIRTNPDDDQRMHARRGPKRREEAAWLIYLLIDSEE
jgi:hypothetical protein